MESILPALIGAIVSIVVCLINNNTQRTKEQHGIEMKLQEVNANYDKSTALIEQRISDLAEKVQKHNNVIERMFVAEKQIAHLNDIQAMLSDRMERLEGDDHK